VTVLLAEPGLPACCVAAVQYLCYGRLTERLGEGAYRAWAERYAPERNLVQLEAIYTEALGAA